MVSIAADSHDEKAGEHSVSFDIYIQAKCAKAVCLMPCNPTEEPFLK